MLGTSKIIWHEGKELANLPAYTENLLVEYYYNLFTDSTERRLAYIEGGYVELIGETEKIAFRNVKRFAILNFE